MIFAILAVVAAFIGWFHEDTSFMSKIVDGVVLFIGIVYVARYSTERVPRRGFHRGGSSCARKM